MSGLEKLDEIINRHINLMYGVPEPNDRQLPVHPLTRHVHPLPIFVYIGHNALVKSNLFRALLEIALQTGKRPQSNVRVSSLMSCLYFGSISTQRDLTGLDDNTDYEFVISEVTDENDSHCYPSFRMRDMPSSPLGADFTPAVIEIIRLQHFTHTPKEGPWTDEAIDDVICQLWIILSKAVTNCSEVASYFPALFAKFAPDFGIAPANRISSNTVKVSAELIFRNICIRRAMINYIIVVTRSGTAVNRVQGMLKALGEQLADLGLTSFVVTKKYGGIAKNTFRDLGALRGNLLVIDALQKLYESLGDLGPYMHIYDHFQREKFVPANYSCLFSFALGYAREVEPSMRNYKYNTNVVSERFLASGTAAAKARQGIKTTVVEREVSEEKSRNKEERERSSTELDDNLKRTHPEGLGTKSRRAKEAARQLMEQRDLTETKGARNSDKCSGTFARPIAIPHVAPPLGNLPTKGTRPQTTTFAAPNAGAIPKRLHSQPEGNAQKADIEALTESQLLARLQALGL